MNILKKILLLIIVSVLLLHSFKTNVYASPNTPTKNPAKIGVFFRNSYDPLLSNVKKNLEDIQKENENKVEFTFFDAKDNQFYQNESIDKALNEPFDLLVINLVSRNKLQIEDIINKVVQKNIPIIIYLSSNQVITNFIKNYDIAVVIDGDNEQAGILQGKILVDAWNANKKILDKNNDNILQYVMLQGPYDSPATIDRAKYSIRTINDSGINTQQLSSVFCNWSEECARTAMESIILANDDKIEAIITHNDAMAIGAIKTLQKYGFNKGGNSKYIPTIGFNALPEAQELIKQGIMTGTVMMDTREHAKAIYNIGMNIISGANPLTGTNYKFDETGTTIRLPYYEYLK